MPLRLLTRATPWEQAKSDAEALCEERCQLALQQQALKYERRIGELEAAACGEPGARAGWSAACSVCARGNAGYSCSLLRLWPA